MGRIVVAPDASAPSRSQLDKVVTERGPHVDDDWEEEEEGEVAPVLLTPNPPWHDKAHWLRDVLRTLGNANDFEGARITFERAPRPRPQVVWEEMIRVCNLCGEPAFASEVLSESVGIDVGATMVVTAPETATWTDERRARIARLPMTWTYNQCITACYL